MAKMTVNLTTKCPNCDKNWVRTIDVKYISVISIYALELCPSCCELDEHGNVIIKLTKKYEKIQS